MTTSDWDPNKSGVFLPYRPKSKIGTIGLAILLMMALIGMLVFLIRQ